MSDPDLFVRSEPARNEAAPARIWSILALLVFGCVFAFLVTSQMRSTSATYDEVAHLPAGYSYLITDDYRMNPEHPPLVKKLAALPLLLRGTWPPEEVLAEPDQTAAARGPLPEIKQYWDFALAYPNEAQWMFGHALLYGVRPEALRRLGQSDQEKVDTRTVFQGADFQNVADDVLFWGRIPILLLGLSLGALVFFWARDLFGLAGGILALTLYGFDPNFIAHSGLVTTDVGATLFMFGAVYFLWKTCEKFTSIHLILTALFVALALVTKFGAVLLLPMFLLIGVGKILFSPDWSVSASASPTGFSNRMQKTLAFGGLLLGCVLTSWVVIWASYGFRYAAIADPAKSQAIAAMEFPHLKLDHQPGTLPIESTVRYAAAIRSLRDRFPEDLPREEVEKALFTAPINVTGKLVLFAQYHRLLPEAYLYGFAFAERKSLVRTSYLMGRISGHGFWNYFPCAFLFKTPLPSLILIFASLSLTLWKKRIRWSILAFLLIPVGVYLTISMLSGLNIGQRHLLPVYPFLFVLSGSLATFWERWKPSTQRWTAILVVGSVAFSSSVVLAQPWHPTVVYPHYLAYFNELAAGPSNGYKVLGDSNLDWGQDLKNLKGWLDDHHITEPINLCYFGTADPAYYRFPYVLLPGSYLLKPPTPSRPAPTFADAIIPGFVAISATHFQGAYLSPSDRTDWQRFLRHATLVDTIGYSIFIYRLEERPVIPKMP